MHQKVRNPAVGDGRARGTHLQNNGSSDFTSPRHRLQVLAQHLHDLGARAIFELLLEPVTAHGTNVIDRLEAYGRIDPEILKALGGHQFPPRPLHLVSR
jgi:hypothetical protein